MIRHKTRPNLSGRRACTVRGVADRRAPCPSVIETFGCEASVPAQPLGASAPPDRGRWLSACRRRSQPLSPTASPQSILRYEPGACPPSGEPVTHHFPASPHMPPNTASRGASAPAGTRLTCSPTAAGSCRALTRPGGSCSSAAVPPYSGCGWPYASWAACRTFSCSRTRPGLTCSPGCDPGAAAPITPAEQQMLTAMPYRHTHRGPSTGGPLPRSLLAGLQHDVMAEGCTLVLVDQPSRYQHLSALVTAAAQQQHANPAIRAELRRWTKPPGSLARDGVPDPMPIQRPAAAPVTGKLAQRDFDLGRHLGLLEGGGSPPAATGILITPPARPTGCAPGRRSTGCCSTPPAGGSPRACTPQPLESPPTRAEVMARLALPGIPQMVLQFGRGDSAAATARRPADDILTWPGQGHPQASQAIPQARRAPQSRSGYGVITSDLEAAETRVPSPSLGCRIASTPARPVTAAVGDVVPPRAARRTGRLVPEGAPRHRRWPGRGRDARGTARCRAGGCSVIRTAVDGGAVGPGPVRGQPAHVGSRARGRPADR